MIPNAIQDFSVISDHNIYVVFLHGDQVIFHVWINSVIRPAYRVDVLSCPASEHSTRC